MQPILSILMGIAAVCPLGAQSTPWPTWRGHDGTGISHGSNPPTEWSEEHNLRWKVSLPGVGNSSPIVCAGLVVVTTAVPVAPAEDGAATAGDPLPQAYDWRVYAFDQHDGHEHWHTSVHHGVPHERGHRTGSLASASPLCDGERIYASFGSRGVHCLDLDGERIWSVELGTLTTRKGFGEGASPALVDNKLVLNWDHEGESFLIALDSASGEELWRTPRDEATNWSTPITAQVDGATQIIVAGTSASRGYAADTGEEIWSCTGLTLNTIPTPVHRDGVVYLMGGYQKGIIQAVDLTGARGDLDGTGHVLWRHGRSTSYVPSPLVYGDFVYFLRMNNGVLTCLDAANGNVHYESQRLPDTRHVYASPIGAADRIYLFSREGTGLVLALGAEYRVLANNKLDDTIDGSPALAENALFVRGRDSLYCIAADR